jgi:hypothetical protein
MPAHVPTDPPADVNADLLAGVAALGWRGIVLVLAGILGLYVLLAFLRLRRIGRAKAAPAVEPERAAADDAARAPTPAGVWRAASESEPPAEDLPWARSPPVDPDRRRLEIVESEVVAMRGQIEGLRQSIDALAEELRGELARGAMPAATAVAPVYGDAMRMAMGGFDVTAISERCGIARAEAELVVALARQSRQADEGGMDERQDRY